MAPFLFLSLLLSPPLIHAQADRTATTTLALKNVTVIDGTGAPSMPNRTIIIRDGQIADILDAHTAVVPEDAQVMDLTGRYVIPGLIDSHVHLATDPSGDDRPEVIEPILRNALYRGITSVRDMAGDARALASLARDAQVGDLVSPDIYYAAVVSGPSFFSDPRAQATARGRVAGEVPWARALTAETDLRQVVAEAKGTGATAIKVYSDLSPALVRGITAEAHRQSMQVWAHTTVYPTPSHVIIKAGADVVSHLFQLWPSAFEEMPPNYAEAFARWGAQGGLPLERFKASRLPFPELFQQMKEHGTVFDPTVWDFWDHESDREEAQRVACTYVQAAESAGVPQSTGTDEAQAIPLHEAIEVKVNACGLTPLEAIRSATLYGAMSIGNEETHGSVEVGKRADLVVLGSDPTEKIQNLRHVERVLKGGTVYEPNGPEGARRP